MARVALAPSIDKEPLMNRLVRLRRKDLDQLLDGNAYLQYFRAAMDASARAAGISVRKNNLPWSRPAAVTVYSFVFSPMLYCLSSLRVELG